MRARKKPWAQTEFNINPFIIDKSTKRERHWNKIFGNNNPIHLEIGCGKGGFILECAKINKNVNFVGLEREEMIIVSGARKLREMNEESHILSNLRFVHDEAKSIGEIFDFGEISRIYLNFSDPWPRRKKWAKRRLTHRNFLENYKKLLNRSGEIHMKTDNPILFEFSLNEFGSTGWRLKNISLNLHQSEFSKNNILTEYEQKFSTMGMPIYRLEAFLPNE